MIIKLINYLLFLGQSLSLIKDELEKIRNK